MWLEDHVQYSFYCFWTPNNSYLDVLQYAISVALEPFINHFRNEWIFIEADGALAKRLSKPKKWNSLFLMMIEHGCNWSLIERETQRFKVNEFLYKNVPRVVIFPSTQYFNLLEICEHQKRSLLTNNAAIKALHFHCFKQFNWQLLRRTDFLSLCYLTGGWRGLGRENSLICQRCDKQYKTLEVISAPCDHLPKLGGRSMSERELTLKFGSIGSIHVMSSHFRKCLAILGCE